MYIKRFIEEKIRQVSQHFPVVAVVGPRQSGKTTLVRHIFHDYEYRTLENLDTARLAQSDPRAFLQSFEGAKGVILDEFQNVPELLSYLQGIVDEKRRPGFFILTGSQNFLMNEAITQTLPGRIYIATLLPLSIAELERHKKIESIDATLFSGMYPSIYSHHIPANDFYPSYIRTYIERDVRQLQKVLDLSQFQLFMKLCAGRIGQILSLNSIANDCGVSVNTAKAWLSILEASYIVFLIRPYHKNYSKRLTKSPKIYFYDPGIACNLLGIVSPEQVATHYLRGGIFESMIIANYLKHTYNLGQQPAIYFWQNKTGHEVDCLIEQGPQLWAIEIKAGMTMQPNFFDGLRYFQEVAQQDKKHSIVVYGGNETYKSGHYGSIYSWLDSENIFT